MPETLVIRLPDEDGIDAQWTVIDDAGTRIGEVRRGALSSAANEQLQRQVLVLVPGTQTVCAQTNLPVRSVSKMLQVVPFALEPKLAGDVADMHFAVGARSRDGDVSVVVVARDVMDGWMQSLADAGINTRRILPDSAGVPVTENGMTVVVLSDEAYLRNHNGDVFSVDHDSVVPALDLLSHPGEDEEHKDIVAVADDIESHDESAPRAINVFLDDSCGSSSEALLGAIHEHFPHTEFRRLPNGLLPRLGAEAIESQSPNLLQGDYASSGSLRKYWLPWRTAAGLVAAVVLLGLTVKGVELFTYKTRYAELNAQIEQLYTDTFPGENIPSNPRLAFERRMGTNEPAQAGSVFLDGLEVLAQSWPKDAESMVTTINFNAGVINLEILTSDVPTLDALRERVSQTPPWEARLTQTSPEEDKIKGRMQLQRMAP